MTDASRSYRPSSRSSGGASRSGSSGRPAGGRPRPGSGRRRSGGGRPGGSSAPRAPQVSALEQALTAAVETPTPELTFAELGLPAPLVEVLARRGKTAPFAIQARALPDALAGRDVLGRAQTGSGKTLAFGLPVLVRAAGGRREPRAPQALVLVPTRELARQVADEIAPLGSVLDVRVTTVYGGAPMGRQITALARGVDVVVATPGRLEDLLRQGAVHLRNIRTTVLDEADHMADLGFLPAVTRLLDLTPAGGQRLLFSATLDRGVERLVHTYLSDPALHAVAAAASQVASMDHTVFSVSHEDKVAVTSEIAQRPGRTLLFVRTKRGADRLAKKLASDGVAAAAIHGDLSQGQRQRALAGFTAGHPRVLVATDVAARGIHVDDVDLVVHYDPPNDSKDYLHRSGRTARAGASGAVLMLALRDEERDITKLHRDAGVSATRVAVHPGHEAVREVAASGTAPTPPVRPAAPVGEQRPARTGGPGGGRRGSGRSASGRPTAGGRPSGPRRAGPRSGSGRPAGPPMARTSS